MLRIFTSLLFLTLLLLFSSCGNKNEKEAGNKVLVDSSLSKLSSPELKTLNAELLKDPDNADLYYKRGQLYLANKDLLAAEGDAKRAIKLDSNKANYFILLCDAYFMGNQTRLSKETLEHCLKINPSSIDANMKLAELYFYVKKYPEAILYINNALKVDESLAKGYYLKGMCYKENGDTSNAVSSFQTAVEQDNKYFDAYVELGLLMAAKKNVMAIEYYNTALRINPKSREVFYNIGKFFQDIGNTKMAVETYKKLLALDPKEKNALYNLGAIE
ncbi:MAG: tetratricopeptide repeat protein, partial [Bacteroidia bacterium]